MTGAPQDPGDAVGLCLSGRISPQVALARLLLGGADAGSIAVLLERRQPGAPDGAPCNASVDASADAPGGTPAGRWAAMVRLLDARGTALDGLAAEINETAADHNAAGDTAAAGIARIARFFDRAVAFSPEASVALYSLGDPAILAAATAEVVAWLDTAGLLGPDRDVLDLGCGIGRMASALAPRCRSVLGLDVSAGMVAEARRRCAAHPNLRFGTTAGQDLAMLAPGSLDLVLAVDSFPYIVQAGGDVADAHVAGAARALRPGGMLAILNLSYRGDASADRADAARWAAAHGLRLERDGGTPFALWDGTAFLLRRAPPGGVRIDRDGPRP